MTLCAPPEHYTTDDGYRVTIVEIGGWGSSSYDVTVTAPALVRDAFDRVIESSYAFSCDEYPREFIDATFLPMLRAAAALEIQINARHIVKRRGDGKVLAG